VAACGSRTGFRISGLFADIEGAIAEPIAEHKVESNVRSARFSGNGYRQIARPETT
jgi:hypothetical protein